MPKSKAEGWTSAPELERITNWAAKGCTMGEIAANIGIHRATLYDWQHAHPEIARAIEAGRALSVECVENSLFRLAVGEVYEKTVVTEERTSGETVTRTTVTRKAPNTTACIFFLKNRAGYRDNPPDTTRPDEAPTDPLSAALIERARELEAFGREIDAYNEGAGHDTHDA